MDRLMEWIQHYQRGADFDLQLRLVEEILRDVRPALHLYLTRRCPEAEVDDVLQESLVAIAMALGEFEGRTPGRFWSWCYRIASNKLNDFLRKKTQSAPERIADDVLWAGLEAVAGPGSLPPGLRLDFEYAMNLLHNAAPPCYDLLWERFIMGCEHEELGEALGVSADAARMKLNRCLELAGKLVAKAS